MPRLKLLAPDTVHHVRDTCLCLHAQRAARALARRFDAALKPVGLTNGQFSLMMALNRPQPPKIGQVAELLAMDRTTLTAALKALERRGLITVTSDTSDHRSRRLDLTAEGLEAIRAALPIWKTEHARLEKEIPHFDANQARAVLRALG